MIKKEDTSSQSTQDSRASLEDVTLKLNTLKAEDSQPESAPLRAPKSVPPRTLGRYQILSELGRGGMGTVYLAEDTVLKRKVALKVPQFEPSTTEQMQARFMREAQIAAQLSHPNVCRIYDVGVIDGQLVMAMEYIEGRTLSVLTKPGKLANERQVVALVKKIALAVESAHRMGLVHRDLKPGNIMLAKADPVNKVVEPKVMDFGLAKSLDSKGEQLTRSGMIVGTPCYMSKEQWSGKDAQLGPAADVYSLGVILYELLTGQLPYETEEGEPPTAWFVKLITQPQILPSQRKVEINPALDAIVMKAIAKEPQDRYKSMAEFAAALDGWLFGKSSSANQTPPPPVRPAIVPTLGESLVPIPNKSLVPVQYPGLIPISNYSSTSPMSAVPMPNAASWQNRGSKKPPNRFIIAGAAGGALLLVLLGVWVIIRNRDGNEVGRVQVPEGGEVEVTDPSSTLNKSVNMGTSSNPGGSLPAPTSVARPPVANPPVSTASNTGYENPFYPNKSESKPSPANPSVPGGTALATSQGSSGNLLSTIPSSQMVRDGQIAINNGEAVLTPTSGRHTRLHIPYSPPEEYDLITKVVRESSWEGFAIGFSMGGVLGTVHIEGWPNLTAITKIDDHMYSAPSYPAKPYRGPLLKTGAPATIVVRVRKKSVAIVVDDKEVFAWEGEPKQLSQDKDFQGLPQTLSFFIWQSRYRITHFEVRPVGASASTTVAAVPSAPNPFFPENNTPATSPPPSSTAPFSSSGNLLKTVPPSQIKLSGTGKIGRVTDGNLRLFSDAFAFPNQAAIPANIPDEYEIKVRVTHESGGSGIGIGIIVSGRPTTVWVDSQRKKGSFTGISEIDRTLPHDANYRGKAYRGELLKDGIPSTIVIRVQKRAVNVSVDGKAVFSWDGDPKLLTLRHNIRNVAGCILFDTWDSELLVTHVEISPLGTN